MYVFNARWNHQCCFWLRNNFVDSNLCCLCVAANNKCVFCFWFFHKMISKSMWDKTFHSFTAIRNGKVRLRLQLGIYNQHSFNKFTNQSISLNILLNKIKNFLLRTNQNQKRNVTKRKSMHNRRRLLMSIDKCLVLQMLLNWIRLGGEV